MFGCSRETTKEKQLEGVIVYDVTFPYNQDDILIHLYPSEYILEFKGDKAHGYLASVGGVVVTEIIADNETRKMHQLLKSFNDRLSCGLNEPELKTIFKQFPDLTFLPTDKKIEIAGYECDRTVAMFNVDSVPPIELLHTKDLGIEGSNWYNQFHSIEGVLLGYEIEQYGMRMKLRAKEIRFEELTIPFSK